MKRSEGQMGRDGGDTPRLTYEEHRRMLAQDSYGYHRFLWTVGGLNQDQMSEEQHRKLYQLRLDAESQPSQPARGQENSGRVEAAQPQGEGYCRTHGRGCGAAKEGIHWAESLNGEDGEETFIPIAEDSGTSVNWIPPRLVRLFGFHRRAVHQAKTFNCFIGAQFQPTEAVDVPLWNKSMPTVKHVEFFVAPPNFPAKFLVVGTSFIAEHGNVWALFDEGPEDNALMVESKINEMEKQQIADAKEQANNEAAKLKERKDKDKQKAQARRNASNAHSSSSSAGQGSGSLRRS